MGFGEATLQTIVSSWYFHFDKLYFAILKPPLARQINYTSFRAACQHNSWNLEVLFPWAIIKIPCKN